MVNSFGIPCKYFFENTREPGEGTFGIARKVPFKLIYSSTGPLSRDKSVGSLVNDPPGGLEAVHANEERGCFFGTG